MRIAGIRFVSARAWPLGLLALVAAAEYAAPWRPLGRAVTVGAACVLTGILVRDSLRHFRLAAPRSVIRTRFIELGLTGTAVALLASKVVVWSRELTDPRIGVTLEPAYRQYAGAFLVVAGLRIVAGNFTVRRALHRLDLRPAQTAAVGFAAVIAGGTLLLSLPVSVTDLARFSLADALFTAASAVTTTGLVVYPPGSTLTPFGQVTLAVLMQIGGLGTMATSASLVILAGRGLRLKSAAALQESMDLQTLGQVRRQLWTIVALTAGAETLGSIGLYTMWRARPDIEDPGFAAVFHSVSAFCTAGLSTFAGSLASFRDDPGTSAVLALLMLLGSLGVPVLSSVAGLIERLRDSQARPRVPLHARLALLTTGGLLTAGVLAVLVFDWQTGLASMASPGKVLAAGFLAVSAQSTGGFSTFGISSLTPATLCVLMGLMWVGGSPGSTAGGIKTTSVAVVVAAVAATVRGRPRVEAFRRTLAGEQVAKALALAGLSLVVIAVAAVALIATQAHDSLALVFEVVSAFGTVGLSAGVTADLNLFGKLVIIAVMFVGRVGPLTLGFALAAGTRPRPMTYPTEKVMIG